MKYKYVPLEEILPEIMEVLLAQDILLMQIPSLEENMVKVVTRLVYSEDTLEFSTALPFDAELIKGMNSAQAMGALITYARRYALTAFFAISTEEDTDANIPGALNLASSEAKQSQTYKYTPKPSSAPPQGNFSQSESITDKQIGMLNHIAKNNNIEKGTLNKIIKSETGKDSMSALTKKEAS